jgi:2-oxoglutarate dehydrogenase E1 component
VPDQSHHRLTEEFGGNEWLVDELYQQFLKDKNSVDKKWWDIFASLNSDQAAAPPAAEVPVAATPAPAPAAPPAAPRAATQARVVDVSGNTPASSSESSTATPATASIPRVPADPTPATKAQPIPAQLPKAASNSALGEEKRTQLRGPAKAIATNMEQSLTVPTATTVRAVPAKALIDNRVVINNHL